MNDETPTDNNFKSSDRSVEKFIFFLLSEG